MLMRRCAKHNTQTIQHAEYLEIQQGIQLVLNDGQGLNQFLCVHGAHYAVNPVGRGNTHANADNCGSSLLWEKQNGMQMRIETNRMEEARKAGKQSQRGRWGGGAGVLHTHSPE